MSKIIFFCFIFSSIYATALDLQEKLRAVVLKVYPENIVAFSMGVEDGVRFQDHIKIQSNNAFIARGICVKTLPKVSFWKIYRTTKGSLQAGFQYDVVSIPLSEVRPSVLRELSAVKLDFLSQESEQTLLNIKK